MVFQRVLNLLNIDPGQLAWDADMTTNSSRTMAFLRSFLWSIQVQGNIGSPSTLRVQTQTGGGVDAAEQVPLRIRLCADADWVLSGDGTIAVSVGTLQDVFTTDQDFVVLPDAAGKIELTYTNATPGTRKLRIGPPPVGGYASDYGGSLDITHA